MSVRPRRVLAIAARDLKNELKGRRGLLFPAVLAGMLVPSATIQPPPMFTNLSSGTAIELTGKVPARVRAEFPLNDLPKARRLDFYRAPDGALVVRGGVIPNEMRPLLDDAGPTIRLERHGRPVRLPGRSLLFALLSASTLTGAIASSIGGERTAGTLTTLLTAAVSKTEIVVGKCLAWGGMGALASLLAAVVAILVGNVEAGWWLLPTVSVAPCTIAIGFWLMRRATDVVGGTTVVIRLLPAALGVFGLMAWGLGHWYPLLGAAVPLGGALVAAGATWSGPLPCLIATGSTGLFTYLLIIRTAQTLEDKPTEPINDKNPVDWLVTTLLATAAVSGPLLGPLLWAPAGNSAVTAALPPSRGLITGAAGLLMILLIRVTRSRTQEIRVRRLDGTAWLLMGIVSLTLGLSSGVLDVSLFDDVRLEGARERMRLLHSPSGPLWAIATVVLTQELFFRRVLRRDFGAPMSIVAHVLVLAPLHPLHGLVTSWMLVKLAQRTDSVIPGFLARLGALVIAAHVPSVDNAAAFGLLLLTVGLLWWIDRRRTRLENNVSSPRAEAG